jgi:hypothetical protein
MISLFKFLFNNNKLFIVGKDKKGKEVYLGDVVYSEVSGNFYRVRYNKNSYKYELEAEVVKGSVRERIFLLNTMKKVVKK